MTHHKHFPVSTDLAPEGDWTKSSYSSQDNGNCVETTVRSVSVSKSGLVGVRDSKQKGGPALVFPVSAFSAFVETVRSGTLDSGVAAG
ncbi:DUF397 domain-containing protein [Streptomyces sp. RY43-2]|uniref:DUF397 domain-containing protein n=1 Tax=Streptomyces macrolidinus TaxID=2952607 RepID=A0ABT0ZAB6_9ACTN|nr:DUF397 domain-containing protein [Streptomyces macrolidinus]MCN9240718.1 DUF397 domain-containing protein [Streptomyces macrolidinus]